MNRLDIVSKDLFNKIRGRFPNVTIGDEEGNIINEPDKARFFDFEYMSNGRTLGNVSISLSEDNGLTIIYSKDFITNEDQETQTEWYNFLKELRTFSKKRLLTFDVRDINKSNLTKRDYQFLATNRSGDNTMKESTLYGKNRVSYQNMDNARLVIRHNESVNPDIPGSRTRHIKSIYIESPEGERFKYPYKHLSGARAMARHVSEGGNQYDDFGKHIIGLSEELSKLRKFKTYMGRSSVMAESLAGYMDVVKERIAEVKKTINNLQKPAAYKEAFESFEAAVYEDVPDDVAENWIDQLTIKQFNEELKDVFPYIYRLVSEATKAKELGPEDLEEAGKLKGGAKDPCWSGYQMVGTKKKGGREVPNCVPREEIELESGFEEMMGQFGEADNDQTFSKQGTMAALKGLKAWEVSIGNNYYSGRYADWGFRPYPVLATSADEAKQVVLDNADAILKDLLSKKSQNGKRLLPPRSALPIEAKHIGRIEDGTVKGRRSTLDYKTFFSPQGPMTVKLENGNIVDIQESQNKGNVGEAENNIAVAWMEKHEPFIEYHVNAANNALKAGNMEEREKHRDLARAHRKAQIQWEMNWNDGQAETMSRKAMQASKEMGANIGEKDGKDLDKDGDIDSDDYMKAKDIAIKRAMGKDSEEEKKTPLGEFILSYFDRNTGQFPKGETAVLTMIEKDYGEEFIEPAKAFIEQVNNLVAERFGFREPDTFVQDDTELDSIKRLAGF